MAESVVTSPRAQPRWPSWGAALLIAAFLGVSLSTLTHYGEIVDEQRAQDRGRLSIELARSAFHGQGPLASSDIAYLTALRHPPLFQMINYGAAHLALDAGLDSIASRHVLIVLWSALGLWGLFMLVRRELGPEIAFHSVLCLLLYPPFWAHAQFNPKDVPLLVDAVFCVWLFLRFLDHKTAATAIASGAVFGATVAMHLNGLFLAGALLAAAFYPIFSPDPGPRPPGRGIALWLVAAMLALVAGWPLLWFDPLQLVTTSAHFAGRFMDISVLYFGRRTVASGLPWHYTLFYLFLGAPIAIVVATIAGIFVSVRGPSSWRRKRFTRTLAVWAALPLLSQSLPGISRYDGMRHAFFVLPPLAIFAASGLTALVNRLVRWRPTLTAPAHLITAALLIIGVGAQIRAVHPFEAAYRNEVVRLAIPDGFSARFSSADWDSSTRQAVEWINANAPMYANICFELPNLLYGAKRPDLTVDCGARVDYQILVGAARIAGRNTDSPGRVVYQAGPYGDPLVRVLDLR